MQIYGGAFKACNRRAGAKLICAPLHAAGTGVSGDPDLNKMQTHTPRRRWDGTQADRREIGVDNLSRRNIYR